MKKCCHGRSKQGWELVTLELFASAMRLYVLPHCKENIQSTSPRYPFFLCCCCCSRRRRRRFRSFVVVFVRRRRRLHDFTLLEKSDLFGRSTKKTKFKKFGKIYFTMLGREQVEEGLHLKPEASSSNPIIGNLKTNVA